MVAVPQNLTRSPVLRASLWRLLVTSPCCHWTAAGCWNRSMPRRRETFWSVRSAPSQRPRTGSWPTEENELWKIDFGERTISAGAFTHPHDLLQAETAHVHRETHIRNNTLESLHTRVCTYACTWANAAILSRTIRSYSIAALFSPAPWELVAFKQWGSDGVASTSKTASLPFCVAGRKTEPWTLLLTVRLREPSVIPVVCGIA